MKNNHLKINKI